MTDAIAGKVEVTNSGGGTAVTITDPGKAPAQEAPAMPDGGFAKFWDASKAAYNWEGHARELAWKLSNKADSKADPKAPNPAATKGEVGDTEAAKVAAAAGVNMDAINDAIASG
ncbi:MAG: hypothetical protein ACRDHG_04610, partial [Anaerolineales bacterium]